MSVENHDLRLKIDAAAAQSGSKAFTAAVKAIQTAVRGLEKDSSGAFKRLQTNLKAVSATKINIKGIDSSALKDLNSFISGQKTAYKAIMDVNRALRAQKDLAGKGTVNVSPATAISVKSITSLVKEFNKMQSAASSASSTATTGLNNTASAARSAAAEQRKLNAQLAAKERLDLSARGVNRSAAVTTSSLSGRLSAAGDTQGAAQMKAALAALRTEMASGVDSQVKLRAAYSQFLDVANSAKLKLVDYTRAQAAASKEAKELARQQREGANSARKVERELRSISSAANATRDALRSATGSMRGLENAFSATYQVGSAFRVMMGSITLGSLTTSIFKAGDALDQFRVTSEVATGSASGALQEMAYIEDVSRKLGVNLQEARDSYSKFAISSNLAGVSADKTRHIFEAVSTAMSVLGKGTEDQKLAFLALEQMMSKGTISAEELRRQLGERLPGAVNLMAKSLGVSTAELQDMLKAGSLVSAEVLPKFADEIMKTFGPGLENATKRAGFSLRTVQNELIKLSETAAQAGFMDAVGEQFRELTELLRSPEAVDAAKKIGQGFADLATIAGGAAKFIVNNVETIGRVFNAVLVGVGVRAFFLAGAAITSYMLQFAAYRAGKLEAAALEAVHSTATRANTKVIIGNTAAMVAAAGATNTLNKANQAMAVGASVARLASLTRVLLLGAPLIGLVATGLYYLTGAFGRAADSADLFATDFDRAMRSAGKSLDDFDANAVASASENAFSTLLRQSEVLRQGVTANVAFTSAQIKQLKDDIDFLNQSSDKMSTTEFYNTPGAAYGVGIGSITKMLGLGSVVDQNTTALQEEAFGNLNNSATTLTLKLKTLTLETIESGKGFLELREKLSLALAGSPEMTQGLIRGLMDLTKEAATAEYNLTEIRDRTVELFGTEGEKKLKKFKQGLTALATTGQGKSELALEISNEASGQLRKQMTDMLDLTLKEAAKGTSTPLLVKMLQEFYTGGNSTVTQLETLHSNLMAALEARDAAETTFFSNIDKASAASPALANLASELKRYKEFSVPVDALTNVFSEIPQTTQEVKDFSTAVMDSYTRLPEAARNYSNLSRIMLENSRGLTSIDMKSFFETASSGLRKLSTSTEGSATSFADFILRAINLRDEVDLANPSLFDLIDNVQTSGRAFISAGGSADAASNSLFSIGSTASGAANGVMVLIGALNSLFSLGGGVSAGAADIRAQIAEQVKLSKMNARELAAYNATRSGKMGEGFSAMDKQISDAAGKAAVAANSPVGGSYAISQYNSMKAERDKLAKEAEDAALAVIDNQAAVAKADKAAKGGGGGGTSDAEKEAKAYAKVMESLNAEIAAIGKTEIQKRILNEQRQAGVTASSSEGAAIAATVVKLNELEKQQARNKEITDLYRSSFSDMVDGIISGSFDAGEALKSLGASLIKIGLNGLLTNIFPATFGEKGVIPLGDGARAMGGPVTMGKSYLVGEYGPERFTPSVTGSISSAATTKIADQNAAYSGQSSSGVVLQFNPVIDARGADAAAVERLEKNMVKMAAEFESNVIKAMSKADSSRVKWRR